MKHQTITYFSVAFVAFLGFISPISAQMTATFTSTESRCTNSGVIAVSIQNGKFPYSYQIQEGVTKVQGVANSDNFQIRGLAADKYKILVTDANGKSVTGNVQITGNYVKPSITNVKVEKSSVTITVADGRKNLFYSYSTDEGKTFSTPQNSPIFDCLAFGTYDFRVTDSCGNFFTKKSIHITTQTPEMETAYSKSGQDPNLTDLYVKAYFGEAPFQYECVTNTGEIINSNNGEFHGLSGCSFRITVTDRCGRKALSRKNNLKTDRETIQIANLSIALTDCISFQNGTAQIKAVGGAAPYQYKEIYTGKTSTNGEFSNLPTNLPTYDFEVKDACGNIAKVSIGRINIATIKYESCPYDGRIKIQALQLVGGDVSSFSYPNAWTMTCLDCYAEPYTVSRKVDASGIMTVDLKDIKLGDIRLKVSNGCGDTLSFTAGINNAIYVLPKSENCQSICLETKCLDGTATDPQTIGATFEIVDKATGKTVAKGSQACFSGLESDKEYIVKSKIPKQPDQSSVIKTKKSLTGHFSIGASADATDSCRLGYKVTIDSNFQAIVRLSDGKEMPFLKKTNTKTYYHLTPATYLLKSLCSQSDTIFLPDVTKNYRIETSGLCPSNAIIKAAGGHTAKQWGAIRLTNAVERLDSNFTDDIYRLYDEQKQLIAENNTGIFPNVKEGKAYFIGFSSQTIEEARETTKKPCDVVLKPIFIDFYIRPELAATFGALCEPSDEGEIRAYERGGNPAFDFTIDAKITPRQIITVDSFAIFKKLAAGEYDLKVADNCGISADYIASVGVLTFTPLYTRFCDGRLELEAPLIDSAEYFWYNSQKTPIGKGRIVTLKEKAADSYAVSIKTPKCQYQSTVAVPAYQASMTEANAGRDTVVNDAKTNLYATLLKNNEKGKWQLVYPSSGEVVFQNNNDPRSLIEAKQLPGHYTFRWEIEDVANSCKAVDTVVYTFCDAFYELKVTENIIYPQCGISKASIALVVTGQESPLHYRWNTGDTTAIMQDLAAGNYSVTVSDESPCTPDVVKNFVIKGGILQGAMTVKHNACANASEGEASVNVVSNQTPFYYRWSERNQESATIKGLKKGTYQVTVTDAGGCVYQDSVTIEEGEKIQTSKKMTLCEGESLKIGNQSYDQAGNYEEVHPSSKGCDSSVLIELKILKRKETIQEEIICIGNVLKVGRNAYQSTGIYRDTLQTFEGCDSIVTTKLRALPSYYEERLIDTCYGSKVVVGGKTYTQSGEHREVHSFGGGCDSVVVTKIIIRQPLQPSVTPTGDFIPFSFGDKIQMSADMDDSSLGKYTYEWQPSEYFSCVHCPNPILENIERNTTLELTVIDDKNCSVKKEFNIVVAQKEKPIFAPNSFTPNGDGMNDFFTLYCNEYATKIKQFRIYSRWGEEIFGVTNTVFNKESDGWDGRFRNIEAAEGVYVYWVEIELYNGQSMILSGEVNLIR